jgi:N4-gp56 family major capsid protein
MRRKKIMKYLLNLQLFADATVITSNVVSPINVTGQTSMSPTMKTFYDTTLLENAREAMIFTQFGKKQPMKGNKVEWRKFNTFAKALTPLVEGVIPTGQSFGMTNVEGTITQHGDFTAVSDRLELESYDDVIFGATEEMGAVEGETYDTLTRNIIIGGNSVAWCPNSEGVVP